MPVYCILYRNKERFPCIAASVKDARMKYTQGFEECQKQLIQPNAEDRKYLTYFERWAKQGRPIVKVDPRPHLKKGFDGLIRIYRTGLALPLTSLKNYTPGKLSHPHLQIGYYFKVENSDPVLFSTLHYQGRAIHWQTLANGMNNRLPPIFCELCGKPDVDLCADCAADLMVT